MRILTFHWGSLLMHLLSCEPASAAGAGIPNPTYIDPESLPADSTRSGNFRVGQLDEPYYT